MSPVTKMVTCRIFFMTQTKHRDEVELSNSKENTDNVIDFIIPKKGNTKRYTVSFGSWHMCTDTYSKTEQIETNMISGHGKRAGIQR